MLVSRVTLHVSVTKADYPQGDCSFCTARCIQLDGQRKGTHNNINRDKATCTDNVVPANNNKAKSISSKGTIAPEDGQLLVTETCKVTRDTNILMF
jgi:hypothetical protein